MDKRVGTVLEFQLDIFFLVLDFDGYSFYSFNLKMASTVRSLFWLLLLVGVLRLGDSAGTSCTVEEMNREHLEKLSTANNQFSLNLLREVYKTGNQFFSPLSIATAMGMLSLGTDGEALEELNEAFGYKLAELPTELVHETYRRYLTEYLQGNDPTSYTLKSANAALLDKNLDVIPSFKQNAQDYYQATVRDVDFAKDASQLVGEINDWVKEKTNGKIDSLLDDLSSSTVMILLNAVYFKGTWKTQFEPSHTEQDSFYNNGNEAKDVPTMRLSEHFPYAEVDDVQAVELPYKGENVSMLVLLPQSRDGLGPLIQSLTAEKLSTIRKELYKMKVHLSLPKFKVQYSEELSDAVKSLGAKRIFSPGADFSNLARKSGQVFVSQILHKAVVEVNEEGSEAAAITAIISNRMRPIVDSTPQVNVNHPFLFAIVDKRTDMILFLGQVSSL